MGYCDRDECAEEYEALLAKLAKLRSAMGTVRKYIVTHAPAQAGAIGSKQHVLDKIDAALEGSK